MTIRYPDHIPLSYEQAADRVLGELPEEKPYVMESVTPTEFVAAVQKTILKIGPDVLATRTREALTVDRTDAVLAGC
jgi:hypothetical protein